MNNEMIERIKRQLEIRKTVKLYCDHNQENVCNDCKRKFTGDISPKLTGDITGLRGDITGLIGNISPKLIGDISPELTGDISPELTGDITGIKGNAKDIIKILNEKSDKE